jgi:RimJ/RimL family protein N-acetyltransferase
LAPPFPFTAKDGREAVVRVARPADARACLAIVDETMRERPRTILVQEGEFWSPRQWRKHRRGWDPEGAWLVAEVGGAVAGILTAERGRMLARRHEAAFGVTIGSRFREIGVGRALLEALESWARDHGVTRITLGVFPENERARKLYASMGYEQEGVMRAAARFPEGLRDVLDMAKLLEE